MEAAFRILAPGAPFLQFAYGPKAPLPAGLAADLRMTVETGPAVWLNLPPARVYRYHRRLD